MTDKAYIVTNEQQEREVLEKLEREGLVWIYDEKPTEWSPVQETNFCHLPYALITNGHVWWLSLSQLTDEEIVFDGRKEEQMSKKYVVSQEFMDALKEWKETLRLDNVSFIGCRALSNLPTLLDNWWRDGRVSVYESNNRLIAIIRWVNGEDVFEIEKPKKWVVRSKVKNQFGDFGYVSISEFNIGHNSFYIGKATRFDTKEEAESWANGHQEVVEVDE